MNDKGQLELIGRLAVQRADDLKRIDAIKEDVRNIAEVDRTLWECVLTKYPLDEPRLREAISTVWQYFNTEAIVGLVKECKSLEKRVAETSQQLSDILGGEI